MVLLLNLSLDLLLADSSSGRAGIEVGSYVSGN